MKDFINWLIDQFDLTDIILLLGLGLIYYGLSEDPSLPIWLPKTAVGVVFTAIACLGYWRGK